MNDSSSEAPTPGDVIRVLVVDDHPVVRMGLRALLDAQPGIEVVGEAHDGQHAIEQTLTLGPDVVLMDLRMPGTDGASATASITKRRPASKVVVVTTYDNDADILRAVEAGAAGYILKDAPQDQLVDAVRAAARGETVLSPTVAAKLMARMRAPGSDALTPREIEVLAAVAGGGTNAEVGRELFISEATVKTHLLRVFAKLGVDDRTAAVTVAMERGLIRLPGQ